MDNKGNMIVDMAIVLIIILFITGIVLNSSELMTQKAIGATEKENTEILLNEFVDNLINNPGNPENWYEYKKGTPGLAIVNEHGEVIPNSVSYSKFVCLGKNYKKFVDEKIFNSKIETSLELIPQESSISSVKIGNNIEKHDTFSVNRLVKCDFYKKYVLKDFQHGDKCNHRHDQKKHSCNYFKVFEGNLRSSDYYLLIDSNEKNDLKYYISDTANNYGKNSWKNPESKQIYLNDKIDFKNSSAVLFIHFNKPNVKAVLISVPKNFNMHDINYDYFRTNDCNLILKAWY